MDDSLNAGDFQDPLKLDEVVTALKNEDPFDKDHYL